MDRIVWLIVLTVVANFLLECSGVLGQTKDSQSFGPPDAPRHFQPRLVNNVNPEVELVDTMETARTDNTERSSRNRLFDNIFKVNILNSV